MTKEYLDEQGRVFECEQFAIKYRLKLMAYINLLFRKKVKLIVGHKALFFRMKSDFVILICSMFIPISQHQLNNE